MNERFAIMTPNEKTTGLAAVIFSWQGLADEFGTFDWYELYTDMCVFPSVAVRVLGWDTSPSSII